MQQVEVSVGGVAGPMQAFVDDRMVLEPETGFPLFCLVFFV